VTPSSSGTILEPKGLCLAVKTYNSCILSDFELSCKLIIRCGTGRLREHRKEKYVQVDKEEEHFKSMKVFGGKVSKQPIACSRVLDRAIVAKLLKHYPWLITVFLSYLYFKPDESF
jgi:hypothetical protein